MSAASPEPLTPEQSLRHEFETRLAELRRNDQARLGSEAILWLALVPTWTVALAEACGFPAPDLPEFIRQAKAAGLCDTITRRALDGTPEQCFWMPAAVVTTQISEMKKQLGAQVVHSTAADIGERILRVADGDLLTGSETIPTGGGDINLPANASPPAAPPNLSDDVRRWAELARETGKGMAHAAAWLNTRIRALVSANETGKALAWTNSGSLLAQMLGGELETAVLTGKRRVELTYRAAQDARYLENYLEITDQVEAFTSLLSDDRDGHWALHYIGMGGVGKTMLLRYLEHSFRDKLILSRVDFDYLSPDYPVRKPGQLLLHFAEELRLHAHTRDLENHLDTLHTKVIALHEALSADPFSEKWRNNLSGSPFTSILREFAGILGQLDKRLLLVLDTCEELTKLQPVGSELPNLEATFYILEALHDAIPSLRVVFAGRRPLALSGPGWEVQATGESYLPKRKDYLRLHILRGFTRQQAQFYLTEKRELRLTQEMEAEILENSRETGDPGTIHWEFEAKMGEERYSPFDLALYANWLKDDPDLKPETIRTGEIDPYINLRIVQRIHEPDVCTLLPAVALLGRFNAEMLRPLFAGSEADFSEAYRQLGEQEWINLMRGDESLGDFYQVEPNLHPRLNKFFRSPDHSMEFGQVKRLLGPHLAEMVRSCPLGKLSTLLIEPALDLLPAADALQFWEDLEDRIARESMWSWAETLTRQIRGREEFLDIDGHPLQPVLLATQIAAQLHTTPAYDPTPDWRAVQNKAAAIPDPERRRQVEALAAAGIVAAQRSRSEPPDAADLRNFWSLLDETPGFGDESHPQRGDQITAALCAGLEGLLDWIEASGADGLKRLDTSVADWRHPVELWAYSIQTSGLPAVIRAFSLALTGRARAIARERKRARAAFDSALRLLPPNPPGPLPPNWSFWLAPLYPVDRIRLEMLRLLPLSFLPVTPDQRRKWLDEVLPRLEFDDADRLASQLIILDLAEGLKIDPAWLNTADAADRYRPALPQTYAHQAVPPLVVSRARARLAMGADSAALATLVERLDQARQSADLLTQQAAERARLQATRRARQAQSGEAVYGRLQESRSQEDIFAAWPHHAVNRSASIPLPRPQPDWPLDRLYCWWDCQPAPGADAALDVVELLNRSILSRRWEEAGQRLETFWISQALREADLLASEWGVNPPQRQASLNWMALRQAFANQANDSHYIWGEGEARLALRAAVLEELVPVNLEDGLSSLSAAGNLFTPPASLQPPSIPVTGQTAGAAAQEPWTVRLAAGVGGRRLAELAMEAGELLALRLPRRALPLLEFSSRQFENIGDSLGAWNAGLLTAIAALHAGETALARQMLKDRVEPNYRRMQASQSGKTFPLWEQAGAASQGPLAGLDLLARRPFGGWLVRLVGLQAALDGNNQPAGQLRSIYGSDLPLELDFTPFHTPAAVPLAAQVAPGGAAPRAAQAAPGGARAPARRRPVNLVLLGVGLIVLGICIFSILLALTFASVSSGELSATPDLPTSSIVLIWILIFAMGIGVLLSVLGILRALFSLVNAVLAARAVMEFHISGSPGSTSQSEDLGEKIPVTVVLERKRLHLQSTRPLIRQEREELARWSGSTPGLEPYREAAAQFPGELTRSLTTLQARLGKFGTSAIPLQVSDGLQAPAWEAVLALSMQGELPEPRQVLRLYRSAPLSVPAAPVQLANPANEVHLVASSSWTLLGEQGWQPLKVVSSEPFETLSKIPAPFKVLHLIGTQVATASGLFTQVMDANFLVKQQPRSAGENLARAGQRLLAADDLPLQKAMLVIVQGEPAEVRSRMESDRESSALLRSYAATLFAVGARSVLVLPSLPPGLVHELLQQIAGKLNPKTTISKRDLLQLVADAQNKIMAWKPGQSGGQAASGKKQVQAPQETQLEQALDVILFFNE